MSTGTPKCSRMRSPPCSPPEAELADGLSEAGLARLHAVAQGHVGDQLVPGLVSLLAHGGQVHAETLGTLSVGGAPVARDSLFRIASTSKPITAAAAMTL